MSDSIAQELWREAIEFVKVLRNIVIITLTVIVILLVPTSATNGMPLSYYLLITSVENVLVKRLIPWLYGSTSSLILIIGSPIGPIRVVLASALFFGIVFSSPISLYLFYRYLKPALYPYERRTAVKVVLAVAGLFYCGLIYGLTIITPVTIRIMIYFGTVLRVEPYVNIADLYEFIIFSVLATIAGFLIPLAIYILNKVFHIDLNIRKNWRYIFVIGYAVLAILTPDPTPITALLILGPPLAMSIIAESLASREEVKSKKH